MEQGENNCKDSADRPEKATIKNHEKTNKKTNEIDAKISKNKSIGGI